MMRIRLSKTGKKHAASFRIVVGPENKVTEVLGSYNPQLKPALFEIDKKRMEYWVSKGAQLTSAVESLIKGKYEFKPYMRQEEEKEEESGEAAGKEAEPAKETGEGTANAPEAPKEERTEKEPEPAETSKEEPEKGKDK